MRLKGLLNLIKSVLAAFCGIQSNKKFNEDDDYIQKNGVSSFILIGFTWSMSFHLLSGIRHLAWDLGYGFEIKTANISGIIVIISSLALTIIFWLFARGFI